MLWHKYGSHTWMWLIGVGNKYPLGVEGLDEGIQIKGLGGSKLSQQTPFFEVHSFQELQVSRLLN